MSDPLLPPHCGMLKPAARRDLLPPRDYSGPQWNERKARTWVVAFMPFLILAVWSFVR